MVNILWHVSTHSCLIIPRLPRTKWNWLQGVKDKPISRTKIVFDILANKLFISSMVYRMKVSYRKLKDTKTQKGQPYLGLLGKNKDKNTPK